MINKKRIAILLGFALLLWGCKTPPAGEESIPLSPEKIGEVSSPAPPLYLTCLFAGDIMAHNVNYRIKDYSVIWDGIREEVSSCALSFANIEMPVDDSRPMSTYPEFNVHSPYTEAAIAAGFNVFSLVNNHTNDQGIGGMEATAKWAQTVAEASAQSRRRVYFSGLKDSGTSPMSFAVIKEGGLTVLFLAVTEILNRREHKERMNYVGTNKEARAKFVEDIKALRKNNPCDIFVLAVHADVAEYVHTISASRKEWYKELLEAGADAVWANHPHIVQDVEIEGNKIVMFACGNVISGQRSRPQFSAPRTERDWTGDGLMMKVVFKKAAEGEECKIDKAVPLFITTYITPKGEYVVKMLDDKTIQSFKDDGQTKWASYLEERKKILAEVKVDTKD